MTESVGFTTLTKTQRWVMRNERDGTVAASLPATMTALERAGLIFNTRWVQGSGWVGQLTLKGEEYVKENGHARK